MGIKLGTRLRAFEFLFEELDELELLLPPRFVVSITRYRLPSPFLCFEQPVSMADRYNRFSQYHAKLLHNLLFRLFQCQVAHLDTPIRRTDSHLSTRFHAKQTIDRFIWQPIGTNLQDILRADSIWRSRYLHLKTTLDGSLHHHLWGREDVLEVLLDFLFCDFDWISRNLDTTVVRSQRHAPFRLDGKESSNGPFW